MISLVPTNVSNPASITRYFGVKDWYSVHFLSSSSGYYIASTENPSLLTSKRSDVACSWQAKFSIQSTLQEEPKESIRGLASYDTSRDMGNVALINVWAAGIAICLAIIILLPFEFSGRSRHMCSRFFLSFVSYCAALDPPLRKANLCFLLSTRLYSSQCVPVF